MNKELSLKELGIRYQETRSEKAFTELYHRIRPGLYNYIFQIVKDSDSANLLVSGVMTAVHEKIDQYDPKWHISTWIYRIAYTYACGELRFRNKRKTTPLSSFEETENRNVISKIEHSMIDDFRDSIEIKEDKAEADAEVLKLRKIVNSLPNEYRLVIEEKFFNDMKYEEIANKHKIPLHTVKNRVSRGKRIIKEQMEA
jgi:RNA polymerase sigma-70 factor (ECF subfamily)